MLTDVKTAANLATNAGLNSSAPPDANQENLEIAQRYAALPADKRARFKARLREHGIDGSILPIVPLAIRPSRAPLSHAQERLWFLWRLDPASHAYNIARALRIDGALDTAALDTALAALVARHEVLRTGFGEDHGVPFQQVRADAGPRAVYRDLRHAVDGLSAEDADAQLRAQLRQTASQPFDLERDPLLRFDVLRLSDDTYVVQIVIHHIISDAWSMGMLIRDFVSFYGDALRGHVTRAPDSALQFSDVAMWQREWIDSDTLARQLSYWSTQLAGTAPVLPLPADRARPAVRDGVGARFALDLDAVLASRLKALSRSNDATLFMTLLHAFNLLLHRYSGETDLWVGVPVAGRQRVETHPVMGFFVNTLVIRSQISPSATLQQQLRMLRDTVLDAQAHEDLPFAHLLDSLQTGRDLSHSPLFQVMFNLDYADPNARIDLPGLTATPVDSDAGTARFDLTLNVIEAPDSLRAIFSYACDMFDAATIERFARDYRAVLVQFADSPSLKPGDIVLSGATLASQAERLYAFEPVVPRIVARAAAQPDAPALYCGDTMLSYAALDRRSNQIARRLKHAGVGRDTRVGVCMTRSVGLPVALLAVWKAGGAYVPLDPDYPDERLRDMLDDAGVVAVVVDRACSERLGDLFGACPQIDIDAIDQHADEDSSGWDEPVHPRQLAYVLYTSGSTGRPKGVALDHEALSLHLRDFGDAYRIGANDIMLQSSTINFDVALHELLPALLAGGAVRMRGPQAWTLDTLNATLTGGKVTFARIPTALWQQWQRSAPSADALRALRQITVGGEALPGDALDRWQRGPLKHIALDNLYGPTETAIAALRHTTSADDATQTVVPIGRPYPGRGAAVFDAYGNRMPHGGAGELCITGACVARGYLGRAALTAERFVPDEDGTPGARLYRSGDLCRVREDGAIQFLGRLDQQVKLRGQRIELGEIEAALRDCADIDEAAVMLHTQREQQQLVAYVVGAAQIDELREALAQRLPAFMVPNAFVTLERLPTMPNGKLDRRALPAPALADAAPAERIAPRNRREQVLLDIWQQVLGCEVGGVTVNFFAAGGDSILSLQLLARARDAGLLLTPKQVFEHPSVEQMAKVARDIDGTEPAQAAELHDAQPLTPIQAAFFDKHPEGLAHWNQAVLLEVRETLDPAALERALQQWVARHDALRLRFERNADDAMAKGSSRWRQRVAPVETASLLQHIELDPQTWESELAAAGTALHRSLDLQQGPLLRAAYVEAGAQRRLLIVIHHLVVDGVSWRVLLEELQALYERPDAALPAVTTPWSVWGSRQHDYAQQAERLWELAWWQRMLHGASAALPLEGDGDRRLSASRVVTVKLSADATRRLVQRGARADDARTEELLLAALAQTLGPWAGSSRLLIDLEGHGREDLIDGVDLSRTVGWFTTQYPLALAHHADPARTLGMVRDTLRAVPDRGFSWGALKYAGDDASRAALAALPVASLRFNYLGRFDQALPSGGRFGFANERSGPQADERDTMDHALDIGALISGERLSVHWRYSPGVLSEAGVERLAYRFEELLLGLIDGEAAGAGLREAAVSDGVPVSSAQDSVAANSADTADEKDRAVFALWMQRVRFEVTLGALARSRLAPSASTQAAENDHAARFAPLPAGVVPMNDLHAPHAVFCIHAGHGLVAEYRSLAKALNGRTTLFGLQAPSLSDRNWYADDFDAMAADYVARIRAVQPHGPYRLLGWSFGGRVVMAMLEQLERCGEDVALAGLIDAMPDRELDDDVQAEVRALRIWIAQHAAQGVNATERALFDDACDVILEHGRIVDTFRMPRLRTPLTLWWSTESVESGKPRDWSARTGASESVLAVVPAGHTSIMHHPMLLDSVRGLFG
ncbi:non-ribosomal peptide synthase domain TIGR01720/amino acid adenylation domain-containing protein [Paraburkholderia fungorum]|uniref:Non-ribosomal peptide synthase domain TIGR01720/amino acid adenylation domain-containing protein n=1 Tax=Paraburkholderia fungorum TaxID=134537 RepID=A0A1H1H9E3_9BURK|nr:non-ribosomal peptide synthetase [Paraburkholderia fungorum]SDR22064.1 non-ribosomal peptide synthase domain TIGR01720/amino acid adenylation domain-containing protein [Paraburkholderia fungorum]